MRISLSTARRLAIRSQLLGGQNKLPPGKEGAAQAVEHLGRVQIDTISVVERAHHHVLWSRCRGYAPEALDELQATDRRVFEYWWGHAAAYLPIGDYRYYLPQMRGHAASRRMKEWSAANAEVVDTVLSRIREEGPLTSAEFPDARGRKRGPWWDWKPAKQALEMLFSAGVLMVAARRNFQRVYDLTERVLPSGASTDEPSLEETAQFVVRRAVTTWGLVPENGVRWSWLGDHGAIRDAVEDMLGLGEVQSVTVAGNDDAVYYAWTRALEGAIRSGRARAGLHILSPFDNLVADRHRVRWLFDFDCKLESYFPAAKRRYGYFCLPILFGDRFVGRLDPKADRKRKTLVVRRLMLEPGVKNVSGLLPVLARKLHSFAAFNGCEEAVVEETEPAKVKAALRRELARA